MEHSGTNEDILDGCSETQKEIIVANEKIILINACAGSGKTTTITKKIIYSLKNNQARPDEIIAITFTKKAAKELKTRIYELGQNFLGNIYGFDQMRIDTIHAFCLNLLKDFYHDLRKYKIADEEYIKNLIKNDEKIEDVYQLIKWTPNGNGSPIEEYLNFITWINEQDQTKFSNSDLVKFGDVYDDWIIKNNKMFANNNIIKYFVKKIETDEKFANWIKSKFKYLYIDEFQDVNYIQYKLINLFINLGIKIVLVGDDDQCIYQFRGSSNRYIINFSTEHPNTKTFNLNTNYRSTDVIVKFANSIISHNKNRIEKNIQNAPNHQGSINDIKICEFKEFDDEIKFATEQIELYKNAGIDYNQIAVLYRTNKTNIKIIKKLKEAGIPFISNNTTTIYEQNEIMIMYIIFQYINETHSFDFFYNKLIVSVDDKKEFNEFLTQICDGKSIENFNEKTFIINILSKINPQLDNEELEATFNYINSFRNELINLKYKRINIQEVYWNIISYLKINSIDDTNDNKIKKYYLGIVSSAIHTFESNPKNYRLLPNKKWDAFVASMLTHITTASEENQINPQLLGINAVTLSTIHKAKGLEWTAVIIVDNVERKQNTKEIPDAKLALETALGMIKSDDATNEEERNIFYIAITRARVKLTITCAGKKRSETPQSHNFKDSLDAINNRSIYKNNVGVVDYSWANKRDYAPITLNNSLLQQYMNCPYAFLLNNMYFFQPPINPKQGFGEEVHYCVEVIVAAVKQFGKNRINEIIETAVDKTFHLEYMDSPNNFDDEKTEIINWLKNVRINQILQDADNLNVEMPFELNFQTKNDFKVLINGRIDLIWNDHGTKKIIDLKTPNSDVNSTNYKFQIELYLYAYNLLNSDQIQSGYVLNVRNDQISDEIIDNTDTEINIQTNIEKLLDAIRLHQFNKNTENCEHCLFNHICKNK